MDIDFDLDPTPAADETTIPATSTQTAPETSINEEVITPAPAVIVLPAPPVPPETSGVKNIEKSPVIPTVASGEVRTSPPSISVDVSVENAIVRGLKESFAKASDLELRLREIASDAESLKTKMHVSTYVSFSPTECPNNSISESFFVFSVDGS